MKRPNRYQRFSIFFAYLFYLGAMASLGVSGWFAWQQGMNSPPVAAFAASVVFFIGGGIVLHVMGRANLPDLRVNR